MGYRILTLDLLLCTVIHTSNRQKMVRNETKKKQRHEVTVMVCSFMLLSPYALVYKSATYCLSSVLGSVARPFVHSVGRHGAMLQRRRLAVVVTSQRQRQTHEQERIQIKPVKAFEDVLMIFLVLTSLMLASLSLEPLLLTVSTPLPSFLDDRVTKFEATRMI